MDPEIQKILMHMKPVNKQRIDYTKIDQYIRRTIRILNQLPYLATIGCCAGHNGTQYFLGAETHNQPFFSDMYIAFEVYDEAEYLKLVSQIQKALTGLNTFFHEDKLYPQPYVWRWIFCVGRTTRGEVKKGLAEVRAKIIEVVKSGRPINNKRSALYE